MGWTEYLFVNVFPNFMKFVQQMIEKGCANLEKILNLEGWLGSQGYISRSVGYKNESACTDNFEAFDRRTTNPATKRPSGILSSKPPVTIGGSSLKS